MGGAERRGVRLHPDRAADRRCDHRHHRGNRDSQPPGARVSANESATIGDIRTVISAQAAYQSANGGLLHEQVALPERSDGRHCVPSYPANGPTFVDSQIASLAGKSGYATSVGSVGATPAPLNTSVSGTSSVVAYAYVASPMNIGQTGVRGFGGDSSGVICQNPTGVAPTNASGALTISATCNVLQ
jgi:hypothetical protein